MTSRKIMHFIDALAVAAGALVLTAALFDLAPAEAASLVNAVHGSTGQPLTLLLGATLATLPGSRRVLWPALFSHHDLAECHDVADAVRRVGLQQRVQAANLYMTDLSDEAVTRAFGDAKSLQDWFGPALADPQLRRQIDPRVLQRIETLAIN